MYASNSSEIQSKNGGILKEFNDIGLTLSPVVRPMAKGKAELAEQSMGNAVAPWETLPFPREALFLQSTAPEMENNWCLIEFSIPPVLLVIAL